MIADNIKRLRLEYGLTQDELADKVGVTRSVIANLEYGRLQNPEKKMPLFRLIAKTFDVPVEWILADDPGDFPWPTEGGEAAEIGSAIASDPVVQSFLAFWAQRTDAEKEALQKAINDFADQLKKNMAE